MEKQCANAMAVAGYLENHSQIENVRYPGLPSHPQYETAQRILPEGRYGAMLNFDIVDGSKEKAFRFLNALKLIRPATSLGDIYTLIVNPARTTHRWLDESEQAAIGIGPGTFRLSVGIDDIEDLKEDLDQALKG
jgi:cystathionine beta-lyase/cystathionine gamma-synthase